MGCAESSKVMKNSVRVRLRTPTQISATFAGHDKAPTAMQAQAIPPVQLKGVETQESIFHLPMLHRPMVSVFFLTHLRPTRAAWRLMSERQVGSVHQLLPCDKPA